MREPEPHPDAVPYDTALPQQWYDDVLHKTGKNPYGLFVWTYSEPTTIWGRPYPTSAEGQQLLEQYAGQAPAKEPEVEDDSLGTLGPCGCRDYHMADCPLVTGDFNEKYSEDDDRHYQRHGDSEEAEEGGEDRYLDQRYEDKAIGEDSHLEAQYEDRFIEDDPSLEDTTFNHADPSNR